LINTKFLPELFTGWVDPRVGLGWVEIFSFLVGLGWVVGQKHLKNSILGRPLVTVEVIPDTLIIINTDK